MNDSGRAVPTEALEQAALWHERLSTGEGGLQAGFEPWLMASADNRQAFERVSAAHRTAQALSQTREMLSLRHEALTRIVVPPRRRFGRTALAASVAAGLALGLSTLALQSGRVDEPAASGVIASTASGLYQTGVGERLKIALADGSTAHLNTSSRLRVAYSSAERRLMLEAGQALFKVAKDKDRPFLVLAGDRVVTAHGTAFDVRLAARSLKVALIEGTVTVASRVSTPDAQPTRLRPNEVLSASGASVSVTKVADASQVAAWHDGFVVFEDDRLADAVAEMNRYVTKPIVIGDPHIADLRVSGAFRTGETRAFIEALELAFPLSAVEDSADQLVLRRRA